MNQCAPSRTDLDSGISMIQSSVFQVSSSESNEPRTATIKCVSVENNLQESRLTNAKSNNVQLQPRETETIPSTLDSGSGRQESELYEPQVKKRKEMSQEESKNIEYIYFQLINTIDHVKNNKVVENGENHPCCIEESQEAYQLVTTLINASIQLMNILTLEVDPKYWKITVKSTAMAGRILSTYSQNPNCKNLFTVERIRKTGFERLIAKTLVYLTEDCNENAILSLERSNLIQEMFVDIKSLHLRHMMLEKLLKELTRTIKRLNVDNKPDIKARESAPLVINFSGIASCFRLLQLVEHALVTTTHKQPWIEGSLYKELLQIENMLKENVDLAQVLLFFTRQMQLVTPLMKSLLKSTENDSDSDD